MKQPVTEHTIFSRYLSGNDYQNQHSTTEPLPSLYNKNKRSAVSTAKKTQDTAEVASVTTLLIKNMVSIRCIYAVKSILTKLEIPFNKVELMNVEISGSVSEQKLSKLRTELEFLGFELMEDKKSMLVEEIKSIIVEMVQTEAVPKTKFSEYLSKQLNHNYIYLSNLFSKVKGITIEQFILNHKIERVKQLLLHNELTLSEIAWKLKYSSVAHLSNQFKKVTGITPTYFKAMKGHGLIAIEKL